MLEEMLRILKHVKEMVLIVVNPNQKVKQI